jgi:S-adenosylmethionine decarboxylase
MNNSVISKEEYDVGNSWGLATAVDLMECDPQIIRDAEKVKQFVRELCKQIDMRMFGETVVVDFGDDPKVAGFSMTQLIETSLISGHFGSGITKFVYLDIFSCKWYDQQKAIDFAKEFFKAQRVSFNTVIRRGE